MERILNLCIVSNVNFNLTTRSSGVALRFETGGHLDMAPGQSL